MRPSIAILITTFNGAEFIGEVLDSIKAYHPSASEIPVYIFDDCSSDQTLEVVRRRQAKVPIHIVQNPRNLGECENVNCAMVRLEGDGIEWAMLLHQDDLLVGPWLSDAARILEQCGQEIGMVCCHNSYVNLTTGGPEDGPTIRPPELTSRIHPGDETTLRSLRQRWFWTVSGSVIRVNAYNSIGGMHPKLLYAADNDFLCRFLLAGHGIIEVNWQCVLKRFSANSQTSRNARSANDMTGWAYVMHKYLRYSSKADRTLEYFTRAKGLFRRSLSFARREDWEALLNQRKGAATILRSYFGLILGARWLIPPAVRDLLDYRFTPLASPSSILHSSVTTCADQPGRHEPAPPLQSDPRSSPLARI